MDGEKGKSLKKLHLKPSALFYKMLIDRVLSFYFFHFLGDVPFSKGIKADFQTEASLFSLCCFHLELIAEIV